MIELYFIRHGLAADKKLPIYINNDFERPLTEKGIKKMILIARGLKKLVKNFDVIYTSPLKRAQQTAQIIGQQLNIKSKITIIEELSPGKSTYELIKIIGKNTSFKRIILVGHEPDLSHHIAFLLSNSDISIKLKKGAVCRIDIETLKIPCNSELIWLMQPNNFINLLKEKK